MQLQFLSSGHACLHAVPAGLFTLSRQSVSKEGAARTRRPQSYIASKISMMGWLWLCSRCWWEEPQSSMKLPYSLGAACFHISTSQWKQSKPGLIEKVICGFKSTPHLIRRQAGVPPWEPNMSNACQASRMSWPLQQPWENNYCGNLPTVLHVSNCPRLCLDRPNWKQSSQCCHQAVKLLLFWGLIKAAANTTACEAKPLKLYSKRKNIYLSFEVLN